MNFKFNHASCFDKLYLQVRIVWLNRIMTQSKRPLLEHPSHPEFETYAVQQLLSTQPRDKSRWLFLGDFRRSWIVFAWQCLSAHRTAGKPICRWHTASMSSSRFCFRTNYIRTIKLHRHCEYLQLFSYKALELGQYLTQVFLRHQVAWPPSALCIWAEIFMCFMTCDQFQILLPTIQNEIFGNHIVDSTHSEVFKLCWPLQTEPLYEITKPSLLEQRGPAFAAVISAVYHSRRVNQMEHHFHRSSSSSGCQN